MTQPVDVLLFDVYGTLFDIEGHTWAPPDVVATMRAKQLQSTWLLTAMGQYRDFREVTEQAIVYAADLHRLGAVSVRAVMEEQALIAPFRDVEPALARLAPACRLGILSNGDPASLAALLCAAGLGHRFDWVISVDEIEVYKPAPAVYAHALKRTGADQERLLFVSSNAWDAAGAAAAGLRVAWVNRQGRPFHEVGGEPEVVVDDMPALVDYVDARQRAASAAR